MYFSKEMATSCYNDRSEDFEETEEATRVFVYDDDAAAPKAGPPEEDSDENGCSSAGEPNC